MKHAHFIESKESWPLAFSATGAPGSSPPSSLCRPQHYQATRRHLSTSTQAFNYTCSSHISLPTVLIEACTPETDDFPETSDSTLMWHFRERPSVNGCDLSSTWRLPSWSSIAHTRLTPADDAERGLLCRRATPLDDDSGGTVVAGRCRSKASMRSSCVILTARTSRNAGSSSSLPTPPSAPARIEVERRGSAASRLQRNIRARAMQVKRSAQMQAISLGVIGQD